MYTKTIPGEPERSDIEVEFPVLLVSANEEFPCGQGWVSGQPAEAPGACWSAFETWQSRIRLPPGVKSRFLRELV